MFTELNEYHLPILDSLDAGRAHRRHCVGPIDLDNRKLEAFLALAERVAHHRPDLDADHLATVARWLYSHSPDARTPPCIRARMHFAAALRAMRNEPGWPLGDGHVAQIGDLVAYFDSSDGLIPNSVPVVGRLDDALLIDLALPLLEGETRDYLDFRRLRAVEASERGVAASRLGFTREDWLEASLAERELLAHFRRSGLETYVGGSGAPAVCFRVH